MTERMLTTWLLTYAAHSALLAAVAVVAERTRWGAPAARRDAFWKLALVGGLVTSTLFVATGSAPAGAAVHLSAEGVIAPALANDGVPWVATAWLGLTSILALRTIRAWRLSVRHAGRRRVIRRGRAMLLLHEILGPAADRVTVSCSRTLCMPVAFSREICVPVRALRELPDDELRALLAHEASHIVRRDAVWLMIAAVVRTLGWWQPLNLVAASRLRLAMELCCDEWAAAEPRDRAALARCLVRVAEWNVHRLNDDGAALATMASRGSALRRRLESLLDEAPRRPRTVGPWLAVATVAVPVVCLAPVVTIASLSRVPAAAIRLVSQTAASDTSAVGAVPGPLPARSRPAARSSNTPVAAAWPAEARGAKVESVAVASDQTAGTEITDQVSVGQDLEPVVPLSRAESRDSPTPLRDAIAAARVPAEPAPSRTWLHVPDSPQRGVGRIARYVGFDITRPKLDVPAPEQRGRNWVVQHASFDAARPK